LSCSRADLCNQCRDGFYFDISKRTCLEICGDGKKFVLACDDGNIISLDGCSSTCVVEAGYVCSGGDSLNKDVCVQIIKPLNSKLSISIKSGTPIYAAPGIITDFVITPVVKRTDDEVQKLFKISFSDDKLMPPQIILNQNEDKLE
jgi:cysteine-rich repeat protein